MGSNKITWISIIQGLAMFLVVLGHCEQWTKYEWCLDFCYGVHMPLFMFISGGLFYITRMNRNWTWYEVLKDKLCRLGIPYLFFISFAFGLKVLLARKVKNDIDVSFIGFLEGFVFPMNSAMKEMWFVAALLLIMLSFPLYKPVLRYKWLSIVLLFISLTMPYFFRSYTGGGVLNWMGAIRYFGFFFGGILFFKYQIIKYLKSNGGYLLLIIYAAICAWRREHTSIVAILGIIGCVTICKQIAERWPRFLNSFRDYSFQIFLLGIYPQMFIELIISKNIDYAWITPLIIIVNVAIGIYIPVLVSKLAQRINNRYINLILGLK